MYERVYAREDLPHRGGFIPEGTMGVVVREFLLATGAKCLTVNWEQDGDGPGTIRNAMPGEYELVA